MSRLFIDVREPFEYERDHVEGALNIPPAELMRGAPALKDVSRDTELVLYCLSGARSNASMPYFKNLGFTKVVNGINKSHVRAKFGV